jgi:tyrosyl-tRNA synthetase
MFDLLGDLRARGLVHDSTDPGSLSARLAQGSTGIYVGFDPTADSLHVGHLIGQFTLRRFQLAGHRPFSLAGGATGMVGDPSGRSEERNLLDNDALAHNVERISHQLSKFLDFEPGPFAARLVNNADWTNQVTLIDFLRDVGKHITVNQMMAKDSVKSRLGGDTGLSYTEFSYMLLQANDFAHLYANEGVELQAGGSDQWGNITAGTDLIRKRLGGSGHGLTWPLLTRADGSKFGKTAAGAVWLDPERTSPYQFRQFWSNTDDAQVESLLLRFSFRPVEDLSAVLAEHTVAPERRAAQRALAEELTVLVHGQDAWDKADRAAAVLFGGDPSDASADVLAVVAQEVPSSVLPDGDLDLVTLLTSTGMVASNGEAKRAITQGSVKINGQKAQVDWRLTDQVLLDGGFLLVSNGKRSHHLARRAHMA